jgi:uncharacterized protein YqgC (DUF456 family)
VEIGWFAAAVLLMVIGVIGSVAPLIPGVPLVLAGVYVYALGTGLDAGIGPGHLVVFTLLAGAAMMASMLANVVGTRVAGGSRAAVVGAAVGLIGGMFVGGPIGLLVGPFVGAVAFEMLSGRAARQAVRSGAGAALGLLMGRVAEFAVALGLTAWFVISVIPSAGLT